MPWQIRLHWLVAILLVITCVTIELRGFAEPGSAPVRAGCHPLQLRRNGVCADDRPPVSALAPPFARYRAQTAEVANRPAHLTHTLIYLLPLTLPVLGVYSRYLGGKEWYLFGLPMPFADVADRPQARTIIGWHKTLASFGYWLIGLHAAAALFHHYIVRTMRWCACCH